MNIFYVDKSNTCFTYMSAHDGGSHSPYYRVTLITNVIKPWGAPV